MVVANITAVTDVAAVAGTNPVGTVGAVDANVIII